MGTPISSNAFVGVSAEKLQELKSAYEDCIIAIAQAGQEYTINGRTYKRADLDQAKETLLEINEAIAKQAGRGVIRRANPSQFLRY